MDWKMGKPSAEPSSSSLERSGWGIMPSTLRPSLSTPAMFSSEPLGLASAVISPEGSCVAEGDAVVALEGCERRFVTEVVAFHVTDGDLEHLASGQCAGEGRVGRLGAQMHLLADVFESGIAHEGTWQQAGFAEDLEAVADAEHEATGSGKALHGLHDRREVRDGTGAQVVAIGETAGDQDGIATFQVFGLMPEHGDRLVRNLLDDVVGVVVAVGAREDEDAEFHTFRVTKRCV